MTLLISILLLSTSFAQNKQVIDKNTSLALIGDKVSLKRALSFHFEQKELVNFYENKSSTPFLIAKQSGLLNYSVGQNRKKLLILSQLQYNFYKISSSYVFSSPHLRFTFKGSDLLVSGSLYDTKELKFLLNACKKSLPAQVKLKLQSNNLRPIEEILKLIKLKTKLTDNNIINSTDPHHPLHTCFLSQNNAKDYLAQIVLIQNSKISELVHGLGTQASLEWVFNPNFKINNFGGSLSFLKAKKDLEQSLNITSSINIESPLHFSDGLDVQVVDKQGVFQSTSSWKKSGTDIKVSLIKETPDKINIKLDLKQSLRTQNSGVFKTNSFSKQSSIEFNRWEKLLDFNQQDFNKSRNRFFKSSFLGLKNQDSTKSTYSLWIKVNKKRI